jgi:hypothetical protein
MLQCYPWETVLCQVHSCAQLHVLEVEDTMATWSHHSHRFVQDGVRM